MDAFLAVLLILNPMLPVAFFVLFDNLELRMIPWKMKDWRQENGIEGKDPQKRFVDALDVVRQSTRRKAGSMRTEVSRIHASMEHDVVDCARFGIPIRDASPAYMGIQGIHRIVGYEDFSESAFLQKVQRQTNDQDLSREISRVLSDEGYDDVVDYLTASEMGDLHEAYWFGVYDFIVDTTSKYHAIEESKRRVLQVMEQTEQARRDLEKDPYEEEFKRLNA